MNFAETPLAQHHGTNEDFNNSVFRGPYLVSDWDNVVVDIVGIDNATQFIFYWVQDPNSQIFRESATDVINAVAGVEIHQTLQVKGAYLFYSQGLPGFIGSVNYSLRVWPLTNDSQFLNGPLANGGLIFDSFQHVNAGGFTTFATLDISAYGGVIVALTLSNTTGALSQNFLCQGTYSDGLGNQPLPGQQAMPTTIQFRKPAAGPGPFLGFANMFFRALTKNIRFVVTADASGGADIRLQVFATQDKGRFACYTMGQEGTRLALNFSGATTDLPIYNGPVYYMGTNFNAAAVNLSLTMTGGGFNMYTLGLPAAGTVIGLTADPIWIPPIPMSFTVPAGATGSLIAA